MNAETFIAENVNMHRGGYRPEEVAELIRRVWREAKEEGRHEALIKIGTNRRLDSLISGEQE